MLYDEETDTFLGCGRLRHQQPAQRLISACCVPTVGFDWGLIFLFFWFFVWREFLATYIVRTFVVFFFSGDPDKGRSKGVGWDGTGHGVGDLLLSLPRGKL